MIWKWYPPRGQGHSGAKRPAMTCDYRQRQPPATVSRLSSDFLSQNREEQHPHIAKTTVWSILWTTTAQIVPHPCVAGMSGVRRNGNLRPIARTVPSLDHPRWERVAEESTANVAGFIDSIWDDGAERICAGQTHPRPPLTAHLVSTGVAARLVATTRNLSIASSQIPLLAPGFYA